MLSRVADSLFWMSRYLERAEHTARVMNVQLNLMLERVAGTDDRHWARVLRSLGVETDEDLTALGFAQSLLHSTDSPSSIVSCIIAARISPRQVPDRLCTEMGEQLTRPSRARTRRAFSRAAM